MNLLRLTPWCLAPPGWWLAAARAGKVLLDYGIPKTKHVHVNRTWVYGPNGPQALQLSLCGGRNNKIPIGALQIVPGNWRHQWLETLKTVYGKAPYFLYFFPELEEILSHSSDQYRDLETKLRLWVSRRLQLDFIEWQALNPEEVPSGTIMDMGLINWEKEIPDLVYPETPFSMRSLKSEPPGILEWIFYQPEVFRIKIWEEKGI